MHSHGAAAQRCTVAGIQLSARRESRASRFSEPSFGVIGKLDYVLLPAMAIFFAVLIYGIAKRHRA